MKKSREQLQYELERANRWAIEAQRERDRVREAIDSLLSASPLIEDLKERIAALEAK